MAMMKFNAAPYNRKVYDGAGGAGAVVMVARARPIKGRLYYRTRNLVAEEAI